MLKAVGLVLTGIVIGGATIVCANQAIQAMQNTEIKISLNGQVQEFKDETTGERQYPITYNNRTYLPLRNVAQLAGLKVDYDNSTNTAVLSSDKKDDVKPEEYFVTDAIHSTEVGEKSGWAEYYCFTKEHNYSWHIDSASLDFSDESVVERRGTWKIENGKLILNELEQTTRVGGEWHIFSEKEQNDEGYANVPYYINAKNEVKKVNLTHEYDLRFIDSLGDIGYGTGKKSYEYLMDHKVWFSNAQDCNQEIIDSTNKSFN